VRPFRYFVVSTVFFIAANADSMNSAPIERPRALPPSLYGHAGDPAVLISAAYTYWLANEDGLATGISSVTSSSSITQGTTYYPNSGAFSGFKVALGTILPHDAWELSAEFTYFVADRSFTGQNILAGVTNSTWTGDESLTALSSQWDNWLYRGDVDLRYTFFVGNYLSLTTLGGLASIFGDQTLTINQTPILSSGSGTINTTQWSWGVGPHVAMESDFAFYGTDRNQFSFFFQGGGALLLSQFRNTQQETASSTTFILNAITFHSDIPLLETMFGIRWHSFIDGRDAASFLVELGWEEQVLLGYNRMNPAASALVPPGNYWMYGLTARARIGF
jgi:hypothetical protein